MELDNQSELLKWTGKTLKRIKKMAEKYFRKSSIFRNATDYNNFSKVSLHKKANSSRKFSQSYSEM